MLLQINGVGKQKISYKDYRDIKFDSLDDYLILAKKAISKFGHSMSTKMLKDEDAIAAVANALMMADWRWDENYQNSLGTKKTKYSYRNQCAIWAIQTYLSKEYQKNKKFDKVYSLDYVLESEDSGSVYNTIKNDKNQTPEDIVLNQEKLENIQKLIDMILNLECLSDRQKDYIKLYYIESQTFEAIGNKYGITREAVRQGLNKAMNIIRSFINECSI
jgi:RNA polymerase sigma factor (sigma-70 family)